MFCPKCGNQLNDGAVFCPKCGEKVDSAQTSDGNANSAGKQEKNTKSFRRNAIIVGGIVCLIALVIIVRFISSRSTSGNPSGGSVASSIIKPSWVDDNLNKGTELPVDVARVFVAAFLNGNPDGMRILWDAYYDEMGASYEQSMNKFMTVLSNNGANADTIYVDGITYGVGEEFEQDGMSYVDVSVHFPKKGLFGGEAITSDGWTFTVRCHKNETPDGEMWFWSGIYNPNQSGYSEDDTGLLESNY